MLQRDGVRPERTGWRDEAISLRHRRWGFDCPAVDLDFVMIEFNHGQAVALIEYKAFGARIPRSDHPSITAITGLADKAGIPFLIVFYDSIQWWFRVHPMNGAGLKLYRAGQTMSEREYVASLYRMRGWAADAKTLLGLETYKPGAA